MGKIICLLTQWFYGLKCNCGHYPLSVTVICLPISTRCLFNLAIHTPLWKVNMGDRVCWWLGLLMCCCHSFPQTPFPIWFSESGWPNILIDLIDFTKCCHYDTKWALPRKWALVSFQIFSASYLHPCTSFVRIHGHTHTSARTHTQHVPDNHQLQGTLHCFSSVLITPGLDRRFSQRAIEGDGVYKCVFWGGMGGGDGGVRMRGHCCCQSFVTLGSSIYHSIIQESNQPDCCLFISLWTTSN